MLYVECNADEVLVRTLGVPRRELRHLHGKGNITNRLNKRGTGKGLLDEDPGSPQPHEMRNYRQVKQHGKLIWMEHANSPDKRIVMISPRLEEWLYERAAAIHVNPGDYGLPPTPDRLKVIPRYEERRSESCYNGRRRTCLCLRWN